MITRFALLRHEVPDAQSFEKLGRSSHWDLLLEREEVCWTWAIDAFTQRFPGVSADAIRLPDHRKHYLDYEGPVSGGRGTVSRELSGSCKWLEADADRVRVHLQVGENTVEYLLQQVDGERWQLTSQEVLE